MPTNSFLIKKTELTEAIEFGAFHRFDLEPDDVIYHYTSLDAFMQIMESDVFHATEYHYLNDMDEMQFVDNVLMEVLHEEFKDASNPRMFYEYVMDAMQAMKLKVESLENSYYVISFSASRDNLTLWSEFAHYGCNLGIKPFDFLASIDKKAVYSGYVFYTRLEQKNVIRHAIVEVFEHYFEKPYLEMGSLSAYLDQMTEDELAYVAASVVELAYYYGMAMKDELYAAENEYRIVFSGKDEDVRYRRRDNLLIPYIERQADMSRNFPALSSVTLAPLGKGYMQVRSVEQFLQNMKLEDKKIYESKLNLRY